MGGRGKLLLQAGEQIDELVGSFVEEVTLALGGVGGWGGRKRVVVTH